MTPSTNQFNPTASRRDFLALGGKSAVGACVLSALNPWNVMGAATAPKPAANVRFAFTTYTWGKDWDIPTLIANCQKAGVFAVEVRTSASYAHGVELKLSSQQRAEVRKQFADSPVKLISIASAERMDWPEPAKLKQAIEDAKAHLKLSQDVGASGVRVFPNQFHPTVPKEKTVEQIAKSLSEVGALAADLGQEVRLEAHGPAGELSTIKAIMDQVNKPSVRVALNSDARDTKGEGFESNFNLVKTFLSRTIHIHNLKDAQFPYQLQINLLTKLGWDGWALLEVTDQVDDRVQALIEQRRLWETMLINARKG
jgi:hypothetical protein